jgi:hypothetical protein
MWAFDHVDNYCIIWASVGMTASAKAPFASSTCKCELEVDSFSRRDTVMRQTYQSKEQRPRSW